MKQHGLRLYNSFSKHVENFTSLEPGKVRLYNCGPTVYKRQHLGNMRRFLFADVLRRSLEFFGYEVQEVTNITDVGHLTMDDINAGEDKMEVEALRRKKTPQDVAVEQTALFFEDIASLNIQPSHQYPKASDHIIQMHEMIQKLIKNEHAYETGSGVYYDVKSFPLYGALSGNTLDNISTGHRVALREEKRHPADFALWIKDKKHMQKWDSPWGVGYPGWHIECSAMSTYYLGSPIDVHTGGEDNRFPHHENEIAQSEGALHQPFVRFWMHNRHLMFGGTKLAKRGGQQLTLDTLREKGFHPLSFRLFVLASHYRQPLDFRWELLNQFEQHISGIKNFLRRTHGIPASDSLDQRIIKEFSIPLESDLNTPGALSVFFKYLKHANAELASSPQSQAISVIRSTLMNLDKVIGVLNPLEQETNAEQVPEIVIQLVKQRERARQEKDYEGADAMRRSIRSYGFAVEDTSEGARVVPLL